MTFAVCWPTNFYLGILLVLCFVFGKTLTFVEMCSASCCLLWVLIRLVGLLDCCFILF